LKTLARSADIAAAVHQEMANQRATTIARVCWFARSTIFNHRRMNRQSMLYTFGQYLSSGAAMKSLLPALISPVPQNVVIIAPRDDKPR
jgi:hypothetical protein